VRNTTTTKINLSPVDPLRDAAAGWGIAQIFPDTDFEPAAIILEPIGCQAWHGEPRKFLHAPVTKNSENRGTQRWLNYYSPKPFQTIPYLLAVTNGSLPAGFSFETRTSLSA